MKKKILTYLERPVLYHSSDVNFWDDPYISQQMLKAHLNPEYEGASRPLSFIELSVKWIAERIPPAFYPKLLDVGSGPGIYGERFALKGYQVTGIDFSKRSIKYAQNSAKEKNLEITYRYQNYLEMNYEEEFDVATFIYCDYGALSFEDRRQILRNIYRSLRVGGVLLLDVFSMLVYEGFQETKSWSVEEVGFWDAGSCLALNASYKYQGHVTLEQTVVMTEDDMRRYCIWNCCFSRERLIKEVEAAGFKVLEILADVAGRPYDEESSTLAILVEK